MKNFVVKQNQIRQCAVSVLTLYLVLMSMFITWASLKPDYTGSRVFGAIFGALCTLLFGYALFFMVKRFFAPVDVFVVDKKGITDNSSMFSLGFIPWGDIDKYYRKRQMINEVIHVDINNYKEHMSRLPLIKRIAVRLNARMGFGFISISFQGTKCSSMQAFDAIKKFCPTDKAGELQTVYSFMMPSKDVK